MHVLRVLNITMNIILKKYLSLVRSIKTNNKSHSKNENS